MEESFKPKRSKVTIKTGVLVQKGDDIFKVMQTLDFESIVAANIKTGRIAHLRIKELKPYQEQVANFEDLDEIADDDWKIAQERYAAISPLAGKLMIGRAVAEARAKEIGVDVATLYRWLNKYNSTGTVTSLIPTKRGWKTGNSRIDGDVEKIIKDVIDEYYLTSQRPSAKHVVTEVKRRCYEKGVESPSHMTIRKRISNIPERDRLRARGFTEKAINTFSPSPGKFEDADYPMAVIQIDHTPADIILVDDIHRLPVGRPWITLAIDIYSRAVTGFYISFDPPSETSIAMCVASTILPKENWLIENEINVDWPVWGTPKKIHVDNGSDFRSSSFQRSCLEYSIDVEYRPVKKPKYGGHVERVLGTLLREIHTLPGSTFSSIKDREGYDSEKHATMTRSEFEKWLMTMICKVYHQNVHSGIGMTPLKKWELGIFGEGEEPGVGLPPRPVDYHTVLLDFLPSFYRTVQTFGVTVDGLTYYSEPLRRWINSIDKEIKGKKKLLFRRDPRDISSLWFYDPEIKEYFKVPFADQTLPSMSIWEFSKAKERLKNEGYKNVNEHEIYRALTELREQVDQSKQKSKKARRQAQKRIEHSKSVSEILPSIKEKPEDKPSKEKSSSDSEIDDLIIDDDIDSFIDIS